MMLLRRSLRLEMLLRWAIRSLSLSLSVLLLLLLLHWLLWWAKSLLTLRIEAACLLLLMRRLELPLSGRSHHPWLLLLLVLRRQHALLVLLRVLRRHSHTLLLAGHQASSGRRGDLLLGRCTVLSSAGWRRRHCSLLR